MRATAKAVRRATWLSDLRQQVIADPFVKGLCRIVEFVWRKSLSSTKQLLCYEVPGHKKRSRSSWSGEESRTLPRTHETLV